MPDDQALKIFLPVLLVVAVTFVGFVKMAIERAGAVKQVPNSTLYFIDPNDPNAGAVV